MENLTINDTNYTPEVIFDIDNKILKITGRSFPNNTLHFYDEIDCLLKNFLDEIDYSELTIICKLSYINSSSSKKIYNLFKHCSATVMPLEIIWKYDADDDELKEQGEEFKMALNNNVIFKFETN